MKMRAQLTVALAVACLTVGSAVQAAPRASQGSETEPVIATQRELDLDRAKVDALSPYFDSNVGVLDAERAIAEGADAEVVEDFEKGFAAGRAALATRVAADPDLKGTTAEASSAAAACVGSQMSAQYVTFVQIWLDSCGARTVVSLMTGGAGLATLTGGIAAMTGIGLPYTAIAAIAAGLLGIGSAAVQWCSRYGRGMIARNVLWPPCYNQ